MRIPSLAVAAVSAVALFAAAPAFASISGTVYSNVSDPNDASDVAANTTGPSAQFTTNDINYQTNDSPGTTIANFLNNPTFTNLTGGFDPNSATNNLFLVLTGSAFLNAGSNSFVVAHDDGVVMSFSDPSIGTVVNQPGPTGEVFTPFNVNAPSTGLFDFTLQYTECCGGPADLVIAINGAPVGGSVPEPMTLAIFGAGLAGLGAMRRFNKRT